MTMASGTLELFSSFPFVGDLCIGSAGDHATATWSWLRLTEIYFEVLFGPETLHRPDLIVIEP